MFSYIQKTVYDDFHVPVLLIWLSKAGADSIIGMSYTKTPDNLGAYFYNKDLHAYVEVISYDKIWNDSEKRNKVLFDKLGILE